MKRFMPFLLVGVAACNQPEEKAFTYPETRKDATVVDDYFGTNVADPYRWLEEDNSEETADWVKRQNELTFGYLAELKDRLFFSPRLRNACLDLQNRCKQEAPSKTKRLTTVLRTIP